MRKHKYAVRRLRCCPHPTGVLATASYDMTVILWDPRAAVTAAAASAAAAAAGSPAPVSRPAVLDRCLGHTEFVAGVAFSLFEPGVLATCAWDCRLCFWS